MQLKMLFVAWNVPLCCTAALLRFFIFFNKMKNTWKLPECVQEKEGWLIIRMTGFKNSWTFPLEIPDAWLFTLLTAELMEQKMTKTPLLCSRVNCPHRNATFIFRVNKNLPVNNRSCNNYFFDMQLNLNNPHAEWKKVLWLVLWRDSSYPPSLNSFNCWCFKDLLFSFTHRLRSSCEGKHAEYAAPEPTETLPSN